MKISRLFILGALMISMNFTTVFADSSFSQNYIAPNIKKTYTGIANSANERTTTYANWYVIASTLTYKPSTAYRGLGMCFSPMVKNSSGIYSLCGGSYQWILSGSENPVYGTWNNGGSKRTYYLGVRLDTDFTGTSGAASGRWNAR